MPFTAASRNKPLELVLHIGSGKTGTSSIQHFLHRNRGLLAKLGYLYPRSPGATRHVRLGLSVQPDEALDAFVNWHRQGASSPDEFRRSFRRRLIGEIDRSGLSNVLFSDEALYGSSDEALRRLRKFVERIAGSVRLVVYLRRQDDHLVSRYQQVVKVGETRRLTQWAGTDFSRIYDYGARLRAFERLLAPNEIVVRRFERGSFVDNSLLQDFLVAAGVDARAEEMDQGVTRNVSLDAESVEFLRVFNLYRVEYGSARVGLIDNRTLAARLVEFSAGPILTLPTPFLNRFMAQWTQANRAVARCYLRDPTCELFRMPRKTGNTTTEQRLDPDRLAHFATLLQLPARVHDGLRRVAEREASHR